MYSAWLIVGLSASQRLAVVHVVVFLVAKWLSVSTLLF
jgi:hypothetical protein